MSARRQFLHGSVGRYGVLIPAEAISGVWVTGDPPRVEWTNALAIDLRSLFKLKTEQHSAQVALRGEGSFASVIVLDSISQLHSIGDEAFSPLPRAFRYARGMFDALCSTEVGGCYPLRLRREPNFTPMMLNSAAKTVMGLGHQH